MNETNGGRAPTASTQPSQLNPFYPFQTFGLLATVEPTQAGWASWRAQIEPFPVATYVIGWLPTHPADALAAYVQEMAGTAADLDEELEAAGTEHLLRDDRIDEQ